eukprot:11167557-Lingulodinium_polyedra.AAC.1
MPRGARRALRLGRDALKAIGAFPQRGPEAGPAFPHAASLQPHRGAVGQRLGRRRVDARVRVVN